MGNITIKQIAELAEVSRGTVDRALNNRGGVNAEVEKRIKKIAAELSYTPNPIAKALANSKRRFEICVLINSGDNPFFFEVLDGIRDAEAKISKYGVSVTIKTLTGYDVEEQLSALEKIEKAAPDGLIVTPIDNAKIISKLNEIAGQKTTVVTLNSDVAEIDKLCFVGCNYQKSGQTAGQLMGLMLPNGGKLGIVTGSFNMLGHNNRIAGFKSVIAESYDGVEIACAVEGKDSDKTTYEKTKEMLSLYPLDGIYFCAGGIDGGIKAVKESGKSLKIITVDDASNIKDYLREDIVNATVCQEPYKQGSKAVTVLFDWLFHRKAPEKKYIFTQNEVKLKYNCD